MQTNPSKCSPILHQIRHDSLFQTGTCVLSLIVFLFAFGCVPEKRVVWSSDGKHAAVIAADGLHLCDEHGTLSPLIAESVTQVAWFPDSRRLVLERKIPVRTWAEVAPLVPEPRRKELIALSDNIRAQAVAYNGDWEKFSPNPPGSLRKGELPALMLYTRDHRGESLPRPLQVKWKELTADTHLLETYSVQYRWAQLEHILFRSLHDIALPMVSPKGRNLAFIVVDDVPRLYVAPIGRDLVPRHVVDSATMGVDWSADGRYLVYRWDVDANVPHWNQDDEDNDFPPKLGTIARRQVADVQEELLKEFPNEEPLAAVVSPIFSRVHSLRDGRILFAGFDLQFPYTPKDFPKSLSLFAIDPAKQATVTRLIPRQSEAERKGSLGLFEVSPDEKRLVFPGGDKGVPILTLATGQIQQVELKDSQGYWPLLPTWRSADEVCFASMPPRKDKKERAEVFLWSPKGTRCLSKDWPASAVVGFLTKKEDPASTQPKK